MDLRFPHLSSPITLGFTWTFHFDHCCNLQCSDPDEEKMLKVEGLLHSLDFEPHLCDTDFNINSLKSLHACVCLRVCLLVRVDGM